MSQDSARSLPGHLSGRSNQSDQTEPSNVAFGLVAGNVPDMVHFAWSISFASFTRAGETTQAALIMPLDISENTIVFGPFETEHFQANAGPSLRSWFLDRVREELLPQITGPVQSVRGRVFSEYDKPRHVGPHSLVKDVYHFEVFFTSPDEVEKVTGTFDHRNQKLLDVKVHNRAGNARMLADLRSVADPDITIGDPRFSDWTGPDLSNAGAKTLEEGIEFGPFATDHFRLQADARFRLEFLDFLRENIIPRVKGDSPLVRGEVRAAYDDPAHLGPHSALKFRYSFRVVFSSARGEEQVSGLVDYAGEPGRFTLSKEGMKWLGFEDCMAVHRRRVFEGRIAFRYRRGQRKIVCPACLEGHLIDFNDDASSEMIIAATSQCPLKFSFRRMEQDPSDPVGQIRT